MDWSIHSLSQNNTPTHANILISFQLIPLNLFSFVTKQQSLLPSVQYSLSCLMDKNSAHEAKTSPVNVPLSDVQLSVDLDDEVVDVESTNSEIELTDMENFNYVSSFMSPPEDERKGDVETLSERNRIVGNRVEAERLKNEGNALLRLGDDIHGAIDCYSKAIALQRSNYVLYNNRAAAHIVNKEYEDAIEDCNSSLRITNNVKAQCRRGHALGRLNRFEEALESVDKALAMKSQDAESISIKATLQEDQIACEEMKQVTALKNEGNILLQNLDFQGAVNVYTKALSIFSKKNFHNNYVIYNNRAVAHIMSQDYAKAIEDCDKSLAIKQNSKAYCRKAQALRKFNLVAEAFDTINMALKLNKNDAEACRMSEELSQDQAVYETDALEFYEIKERSAGDIVVEWMSAKNNNDANNKR